VFVTSPGAKRSSQCEAAIVQVGLHAECIGLSDEFKTLLMLTDKPMTFGERILAYPSATTFWTSCKNRYQEVLPREATRVRLSSTGTDGSDYINANYVSFEDRADYISTQAPISSTFADFWRMVWEQNSTVIVMLTKFVERKQTRASIYWPMAVGCPMQFGDITVTLTSEFAVGAVDVRLFQLSDGISSRSVAHLHYTGWPDFGVPSATKEILELVNLCNIFKQRYNPESPLIVHCSAGIGRAGTFIAIHKSVDYLLSGQKQLAKPIDLVYTMRQCRNGMVQTEEQYMYIHRCIADFEQFFKSSPSSSSSGASSELRVPPNRKSHRCSMDQNLLQILNMKPCCTTSDMECN